MTHYTAAAHVQSILKFGLVPGQREILVSVFPAHDIRHTKSGRSVAPVGIVLKVQTMHLTTELWGTTNANVALEQVADPSMIDHIYLAARPKVVKGRTKRVCCRAAADKG